MKEQICIRHKGTLLIATPINRSKQYKCEFTSEPFKGWRAIPEHPDINEIILIIHQQLCPEMDSNILKELISISSNFEKVLNITENGIFADLSDNMFIQYEFNSTFLTIGCKNVSRGIKNISTGTIYLDDITLYQIPLNYVRTEIKIIIDSNQ